MLDEYYCILEMRIRKDIIPKLDHLAELHQSCRMLETELVSILVMQRKAGNVLGVVMKEELEESLHDKSLVQTLRLCVHLPYKLRKLSLVHGLGSIRQRITLFL